MHVCLKSLLISKERWARRKRKKKTPINFFSHFSEYIIEEKVHWLNFACTGVIGKYQTKSPCKVTLRRASDPTYKYQFEQHTYKCNFKVHFDVVISLHIGNGRRHFYFNYAMNRVMVASLCKPSRNCLKNNRIVQ